MLLSVAMEAYNRAFSAVKKSDPNLAEYQVDTNILGFLTAQQRQDKSLTRRMHLQGDAVTQDVRFQLRMMLHYQKEVLVSEQLSIWHKVCATRW